MRPKADLKEAEARLNGGCGERSPLVSRGESEGGGSPPQFCIRTGSLSNAARFSAMKRPNAPPVTFLGCSGAMASGRFYDDGKGLTK